MDAGRATDIDTPTPPEPAPEAAAPPAAPQVPRSRRRVFALALLLAVAIVAVGIVTIVRGFGATAGPDGAVRGYFAALASGDAAEALGYGTVPSGDRALLTDRVLDAQVSMAPIENVTATIQNQSGDTAQVRVSYALAFAAGRQQVQTTVVLHRSDDDWRLDHSAVPTQLLLSGASGRATLLGAALPKGSMLMFPAAAPISFDTPYLQLDPRSGYIAPDASTSTTLDVQPTSRGKDELLAKVRSTLQSCLGKNPQPRCPLPTERTVLGSVSGTLTGKLADEVAVSVAPSENGKLRVTGPVAVRGSYRELEFDNTVDTRTNTSFKLPVDFSAYAVSPLTLIIEAPAIGQEP